MADEIEHKEDSVLDLFWYTQSGISTPYLSDKMEYSTTNIHGEDLNNDTLYAVLCTGNKYLPLYELAEDSIKPFFLDKVGNSMFIIDVETIVGSLCVFKDLGGQ